MIRRALQKPTKIHISLLSHLVLMVVPLSGGLLFLLGRRIAAVEKASAESNAGGAN